MKLSSLPIAIQQLCQTLRRGNLKEEEQIVTIQAIFQNMIAFLGKLCFLEYLQNTWKSPDLNYQLFKADYPKDAHEWLSWIRRILNYFVQASATPVLYPLLQLHAQYPSMRQETEQDDRITKLLSFTDMAAHVAPLIFLADIEECREQLDLFLEEFQFLDASRYNLEEQKVYLIFGERMLCLSPLFDAHLGNESLVLEATRENKEVLTAVYRLWLPADFEKYLQERQGLIVGDIVGNTAPHYVFPPWLELQLEDCLEKIFTATSEIGSSNILLIEGYPATGKTALAINLPVVMDKFQPLVYYIVPATAAQECNTFCQWLRLKLTELLHLSESNGEADGMSAAADFWSAVHECLTQSQQKIIVAIDGIEHLPPSEQQQFLTVLSDHSLPGIVFLLFKRLFEAPALNAFARITLQPQDNVYFEQSFHADYLQELKNRYLRSPLAVKVLRSLYQATEPLAVAAIAERLNLFTPDVFKTVLAMKPLLQMTSETIVCDKAIEQLPIEQYRLFHPIIGRLLD